jgi:RNA polymerase sigma factor (sigma-70 family)
MVQYATSELLSGILRNDTIVLQFIYKNFYSSINFFIKKNSGTDEDANDIFQEAIIIIYRKLKSNNLVLDCSFETYIFSVCRYLWIKQLSKIKYEKELIEDNLRYDEEIYDEQFEQVTVINERYRLYQKHFSNLSKECQKILQLSFDKVSPKTIAQVMDLKNEKYVRKKKYDCKELLIENIKQDLEFKNYKRHDN